MLMQSGGNGRLRNLLDTYEIEGRIPIKVLYLSNLLDYYRKLVIFLIIIITVVEKQY